MRSCSRRRSRRISSTQPTTLLYLGQIYTPLVLACIVAWLRLEKGDYLVAGIMIGLLISMKPNFAVWPVLLFLAGHRMPSVVTIATAVVIAAVPLLIFVSGIYLDWLHLVATDGGRAVFLRKRVVCRTCSAGGPPGRGHRSCSRIIAFAGSVGFFSAGRQ